MVAVNYRFLVTVSGCDNSVYCEFSTGTCVHLPYRLHDCGRAEASYQLETRVSTKLTLSKYLTLNCFVVQ